MPSVIRAGINENGTMTKQTTVIPVLPHIPARIGSILFHAGYGVPEGTLYCDGSAISRTTYSALFTAISTIYGAGDGSTTFALPDFRGYFLRGANGTNSAAMGTAQGDAIRNVTNALAHIRSVPTRNEVPTSGNAFHWIRKETRTVAEGADTTPMQTTTLTPPFFFFYDMRLDLSQAVPTAAEVRPINYAVNWVIVYE